MTSSRATTAWLATVLAAVAVGVSHGQSPDQQIETQVTQALREEAVLRSVTVSVQEQVVTLGGPVPSLWAKETAIDAARGVEQVRFVVSDLMIARAESDEPVGTGGRQDPTLLRLHHVRPDRHGCR